MNANTFARFVLATAVLAVGSLTALAEQQTYTLKFPSSDSLARNYFPVGGGAYSGTMYTPGDDVLLPAGAAETTFRLITASSVRYGGNLVLDVDEALTRNYDVSLDRNPDSVGVTFRRRGLTIFIR